jgi:phage tail sheath protein FI
MAERILTSPGVTTREIDLSGPRNAVPFGVPAGVIGTSNRGPAFVPVVFGTRQDFFAKFGETDGEKFGPLAVSEWMRNSTAGAFVRILGVGNGKKRNTTTGKVTNAGFVVGASQTQPNGLVGGNEYANANGTLGNVSFLACVMSESAGSTIFSTAGLQASTATSACTILRGVLMAPSGVVLKLSGNNGTAAGGAGPSASTVSTVAGPQGGITGSLNVSGSQSNFVMLLNGHQGTPSYPRIITASLDPSSPQYFSKVLNKDPLKIEPAGHLLYSHYDFDPSMAVVTGSGVITSQSFYLDNPKGILYEDIVFLTTGSATGTGTSTKPEYKNFQTRFTTAVAPSVISQASIDLFKVHAIDDGQIRSIGNSKSPEMPGANDKFKISIVNIRKSTSTTYVFGTFDLVVRDFYDTDDDPIVLESFSGLSLDASSDNFIARRVGDMRSYFDFDQVDDEQRLIVEGSFSNVSNFIRVELSSQVAVGDHADDSLPIGFRGASHLLLSGSAALTNMSASNNAYENIAANLGSPIPLMNEPPVPFREHLVLGQVDSLSERTNAKLYWGVQFEKKTSPTQPNLSQLPDPTVVAMTSFFPNFRLDALNVATGSNPGQAKNSGGVLDCDLFNNNKFILTNLRILTGSNGKIDTATSVDWRYIRQGGISPNETAKTRALSVVTDFGDSALGRYLKFSFFVQSGFDGRNIFNEDKVKMSNNAVRREMEDVSGETQESSATVAAYLKALDIMGRTSDVEIQLLAIPGIRESVVTDEAINTVENRFDAMYVMDIQERDALNAVVTSSLQQPHVQNTVTAFGDRALDTSFSAAYFPNVTMTDPVKNTLVEVPPSVSVMGALALNDKLAHPWFAPAGSTRGVLQTTSDVSVRINQENADRLYSADINPIRKMQNNTVQVFGQKTLMQAQSALDRINVRRLLIDVRRQVRMIANRFLFEPNREATLAAFSATVQPVLQRIQQQQGVDRYKVIIDTTTTTQADVENNTIRGKIFLQPTRAVEFVSLDFVVTNAGAEE